MNEYPFPPDEPTDDRSKWFKWVIVFLAIVFCAYQFGFKPLTDDQRSQWDVQDLSDDERFIEDDEKVVGDVLLPGYHFMFRPPFFVVIDQGEVGIRTKGTLGWNIKNVPVTEIPIGYVGVITDKRDDYVQYVLPKVLKPGRYYLNPELWKIDKVFTGKQTYYFGGDEDE